MFRRDLAHDWPSSEVIGWDCCAGTTSSSNAHSKLTSSVRTARGADSGVLVGALNKSDCLERTGRVIASPCADAPQKRNNRANVAYHTQSQRQDA
jgi:hypothetical protein